MYSSKIKSIKKVGKVETYDLHTPKYNNFFLKNGILSHNSGKSSFVRTAAKYLDPNFTEANFALTAEEFIKKTNQFPEYSAIILDESFESMSSKVSQSKDFMRILNHLQLIRQKRLFIFLCLPNFFDLQKTVALFRTSHLFIVRAAATGERGFFSAYDRKRKKSLYIKGYKHLDELAVPSNFSGRFTTGKKCIDVAKYEARKRQHLMDQDKKLSNDGIKGVGTRELRLRFGFVKLNFDGILTRAQISKVTDFEENTVAKWEVLFKRSIPSYPDNRPKGFNKS